MRRPILYVANKDTQTTKTRNEKKMNKENLNIQYHFEDSMYIWFGWGLKNRTSLTLYIVIKILRMWLFFAFTFKKWKQRRGKKTTMDLYNKEEISNKITSTLHHWANIWFHYFNNTEQWLCKRRTPRTSNCVRLWKIT